MKVGDSVEIKESSGSRWRWTGKLGLITGADRFCYSVRRDDNGEHIRDVREHFREPKRA